MTNHLHVLVQVADRPLGKIMQRIAMRYSRHRHRSLRKADSVPGLKYWTFTTFLRVLGFRFVR